MTEEIKGIDQGQEAELLALAADGKKGQDFNANDELKKIREQAEKMPTGELFESLFFMGFGLVAERRGAHWALTEKEASTLGFAVGDVVDKYLPDIKTGPEITLVMASGYVFLPRLAEDKRIQKEAEKNREAANNGDKPEYSAPKS